MSLNFAEARAAMVEQQIRPWEVLDPRVLDTLATVPREDFVPAAQRQLAYADLPLLQALGLSPGDEVLEIGTGSGYLTACLARLAREVVSIDRRSDFIDAARLTLDHHGASNVRLECVDAFAFQPGRLFDAIAVTAAVAEVPEIFSQWLKPEGRLFVIRGQSPVQEALRITRRGEHLHSESLFETDVPYLHGAEPVPQFTL